jgi:lipopolysaccharide biosynthesis glycosyltransferase
VKHELEMIHIVVAADISYQQHLGVMLCSLFENNANRRMMIHLILNFKENKDSLKLRKLVRDYNRNLRVYQVEEGWGKDLKVDGHVSVSTYYRLLIPTLLPNEVEKVLYLDSDMVVLRSIDELWNTNLDNKALAAVVEPSHYRHAALNISPTMSYFNAGVMLMNLTIWRNEKLAARAVQFVHEHPEKIEFWDQDALNATLPGRWKELPSHWNQTSVVWDSYGQDPILPGIVHFTGSSKPWHYHNQHPQRDQYFHYLKLTPWKSFKIAESSHWHSFKQLIKVAINGLARRPIFKIYAADSHSFPRL